MAGRYESPTVKFDLTHRSPFSYSCKACSRCCHHKAIRLSPYEILRISRALHMSTTTFITKHTESGGTVLRTQKDNNGACIFLDTAGCSIHADRPLVCRLYPLAAYEEPEVGMRFGLLEPANDSRGVFGVTGSVEGFLSSQDIEHHLQVNRRYRAAFNRMSDRLSELDDAEFWRWPRRQQEIQAHQNGELASQWIDIDRSVLEYCSSRKQAVPDDIDSIIDLHIAAIDDWVDSFCGRAPSV